MNALSFKKSEVFKIQVYWLTGTVCIKAEKLEVNLDVIFELVYKLINYLSINEGFLESESTDLLIYQITNLARHQLVKITDLNLHCLPGEMF